MMEFVIQRHNPELNKTYLASYKVNRDKIKGVMLLDALEYIKTHLDNSLAFRRSCGGGVCGSDGMNVNGKNGLACQTPLADLPDKVNIYPLTSMPIIRDLVVDMSQFYRQYESVEPFLQADSEGSVENLQFEDQRKKLDGLYECILCGCCTSACPSSWWNPDKFVGPQGLLTAARFIFDSRDKAKKKRLNQFNDRYRLYRCRGIFNCTSVCPKGLNPAEAIAKVRLAHAKEGECQEK